MRKTAPPGVLSASPGADASEGFDVVFEAGRGTRMEDLWDYRGLFYFLAWRDILVRYKQTTIGIAWAVLRPVLAMGVLTVVFGRFAGLSSEGAPYPVFVLAGLLPWQLFASGLHDSSESLIVNSAMLTKVYFPRLVIPASAVTVAVIDFLLSFGVLVVMMAAYGYAPTWRIIALPAFLALCVGTAFGAGLWFAALAARYRDVRHVVPFLLQVGLFASPVGFSSSVVPPGWRFVYALNPLVGAIDGFRWSLLRDGQALDWLAITMSAGTTVLLLVTGMAYFRRTERVLADVI
jgi:lipopolysaccharide transport system permease protein